MIKLKKIINKIRDFFAKKTIWGVGKRNFLIYLIGLIISVVVIVPYFWFQCPIFSILMSIGASGFGAIILAYFIERVSIARDQEYRNLKRENLLQPIIFDLQNSFCTFIYQLYLDGYCIDFSKDLIDNIDAYCEQEKNKMFQTEKYDTPLNFHPSSIFSSGLLNYACDDIINNRSNNMISGMFDDNEIKTIKHLQIWYNKMIKSSLKWDFITNLKELLFDLFGECFSKINTIELKENENKLEFYFGGKRLIILRPM